MKKTAALLFTLILVCTLFPITSFAAGNTTITVGGTYYLDDFGDDYTIGIETTEAVVLSQRDSAKSFNNIVINCMSCDTDLTIDGLKIVNNDLAPLSIIDYECTLTLSGESTLSNAEGSHPALRVSYTGELTTKGNGRLIATGGYHSAGIGGKSGEKNGRITIDGDVYIEAYGGKYGTGIGSGAGMSSGNSIHILNGRVIAYGGYVGAGIGGCSPAGIDPDFGGNIVIDGGDVYAKGGYFQPGIGGYGVCVIIRGGTVYAHGTDGGSGIGCNYPVKSSIVSITGGTVYAYGSEISILSEHFSGAGIGGSSEGICNAISISGGTVTAIGGSGSAGIGGAKGSSGECDITITGGTIFASGNDLCDDIGDGIDSLGESDLSIYNDTAKVFLEHDRVCSISTSFYHFPLIYTDADNMAYGQKMPYEFDSASMYISRVYNVTYNKNGAKGTPPDVQEVIPAGYVTISSANSLSYAGKYFAGWNTHPNGAKEMFQPGDSCQINGDVELFAIWNDNTATISLSDNSLTLNAGRSAIIAATTENPNPDNDMIYWTTSDPSVAGVSQSGRVTGIGAGRATITAYFSGKSASCSVEVKGFEVSSVSLNHNSKTTYVGEMFALSAKILPSDAAYIPVSWYTSDSSVATVSTYGIVTSHSKGTCTIKLSAGGVSDYCKVVVQGDPPTVVESLKLTIKEGAVTMLYVGDTVDLLANIFPSDAYDQTVTWQSSDESVASVANGKITAVSPGDAAITATSGGISDTYLVAVKDKEEAAVSPSSEPLPKDIMVSFEMDAENLPYGTEYIRLPNGEIVPVKGGSVVISAAQSDITDGALIVEALNSDQKILGNVSAESGSAASPITIIILSASALLVGAGGALVLMRLVINKRQ